MNYELVTNIEDLKSRRELWHGLAQHESHYEQNFDVILELLDDEARPPGIFFIFFLEGQKLLGVAPFYCVNRRIGLSVGLISLWSYKLEGWKLFGNSIFHIPALSEEKMWTEACRILSEEGTHILETLFLERQIIPHAVFENAMSHAGLHRYRIINSKAEDVIHFLDFKSSYEEYLASLSAKSRHNYRSSVKKLSAKFAVEMKKYVTPADVGTLLKDLNQVYNQSWQSKSFGAKDRATEKAIKNHQVIAAQGLLRAYVLYCNAVPVSYVLGYKCGETFLHEEIGYMLEYRKDQPGKVLEWLLLEDLMAEPGVKRIDYDTGENEYKLILGNSSMQCRSFYITRKYSSLYMVRVLQSGLSVLYRRVRALLIKTGLDSVARKILKHR